MAELLISREELAQGAVCLRLMGALDSHNVTYLQSAVDEIPEHKRRKLIVDLSHVSFMSSAGLGTLADLLFWEGENSGKLVLVAPGPQVRSALEVLGLSRMFTYCDDVASALKEFSP